jgi:hypothetical protein
MEQQTSTAVVVWEKRERIESDERAIREAERQAAIEARREVLRPDAEKAKRYIDALLSVELPSVNDFDLGEKLIELQAHLLIVRRGIEQLETE